MVDSILVGIENGIEALRASGVKPQKNGKYAAMLSKEQIEELKRELADSPYPLLKCRISDKFFKRKGLIGEYNGIEIYDFEEATS